MSSDACFNASLADACRPINHAACYAQRAPLRISSAQNNLCPPPTCRAPRYEVLLPSTLLVHPLHMDLWQALHMMPSLLWRMEGMVSAHELRERLKSTLVQGGGSTAEGSGQASSHAPGSSGAGVGAARSQFMQEPEQEQQRQDEDADAQQLMQHSREMHNTVDNTEVLQVSVRGSEGWAHNLCFSMLLICQLGFQTAHAHSETADRSGTQSSHCFWLLNCCRGLSCQLPALTPT